MSAQWKVGSASGDIIDATTGETVACQPPPESEADEARWAQNAPVLIAAPDLLAFAEGYLASDDPCVRGDGTCNTESACVACDLRADACAAIAKARGGQ